jgi:hypothetical protein
MGTSRTGDCAFAALVKIGEQPSFDIECLATELARLPTYGAPLRVLFDWSMVESWPVRAPSAAAIAGWNRAAPSITRSAFVHAHKWDRQAALLAALLRVANVEVLSFHPTRRDQAIAWLQGPLREMSFGRKPCPAD